MKRFIISLIIVLAASCGRNNDLSRYTARINVLLETNDNKEISDNVESISVIPLNLTEDWKYMIYPSMSISNDLFVMFDPKFYRLMAYGRQEYNQLFSKDVKGRGRGELTTPGNLFVIDGDTICLYDQGTGLISMYDLTGDFIGTLNYKERIVADYVYPVKNQLVAISQSGSGRNNRDYVSYYKRSGELLDRQLKIPDEVYYCGVYSGDSPTCYMFNDTLRFIMPFTYNIFSSTFDSVECSYLFETSKTIPSNLFKESNDVVKAIGEIMKDGYVWNFNGIAETNDYLTFSYYEGQKMKKAMMDKRSGSVVINNVASNPHYDGVSVVNIWRYILSCAIIVSADNDYFYASVPSESFDILSATKDILDNRLEDYLQSYQVFKNKNVDVLDKESCVMVKIKIK